MKNLTSMSKIEQANALSAMKVSLGWNLLIQIIEEGEIEEAKRALEETTHKTLAEVEFLQYKIKVCKSILGMPDAVIEEALTEQAGGNEVEEKNDDPFYSSAEEIAEDEKVDPE